jgi:hypothetical protein
MGENKNEPHRKECRVCHQYATQLLCKLCQHKVWCGHKLKDAGYKGNAWKVFDHYQSTTACEVRLLNEVQELSREKYMELLPEIAPSALPLTDKYGKTKARVEEMLAKPKRRPSAITNAERLEKIKRIGKARRKTDL